MFGEVPVYGVSDLVVRLRELLASELGDVLVEGEVSSLHRSRIGHWYFDLRDEEAQLRVALFRRVAERLAFEPEEGMRVRARAHPDVFAPRGALQLIVEALEPAGEGALRVASERLFRRLLEEGLFDEAAKRPLPADPRRIGLVTSLHGEAIHDFLRVLGERRAAIEVLVCDARVQGEGAWREVVRALHALASRPGVEAIVLTRGGGSLEDLWTFNREELVRAIFELEVPVISAIGHERDVVLSDWVADRRAATPTAAAALLAPDAGERLARLESLRQRLSRQQFRRLEALGVRLAALRRGLVHPSARLRAFESRLAGLRPRLERALEGRMADAGSRVRRSVERLRAAGGARDARERARLRAASGRLHALSPLAVLGRGFSLTRREADLAILRSPDQVRPDDPLRIELAQGTLRARVVDAPAAGKVREA